MAKKETKQDKTLDQVLADIEKQFGKGSIMKLGENNNMEVEVTSSGKWLSKRKNHRNIWS